MKRLLIFLILLIQTSACYSMDYENEFATEEMRNSTLKDEVLLNNDKYILNNAVNSSKSELEEESPIENSQEEFKLFEFMGKNDKSFTEEAILAKIYHSKITRTDIPSFLLQDELTFDLKDKLVKEIQFFGAYRGDVTTQLKSEKFSTLYDNITTEIGMLGKLKNDKYDFRISFLPIPKHGKSYLDTLFSDVYIVNSTIPNHKIMVGYSRVQAGVEAGSGGFTLPFVERSQIARNFGSVRSLSAKISGNYTYADYSLALGSSSRSLVRGFPGAEFTGWFNLKPFGNHEKLGKLTFGTGISSGHNKIDYSVGSFYVGYKYKNLWTNFETSIADGYNGSTGISSNKAYGWAYTAGWKFNPHVQLIGRMDQFDPNRNISGDLKREYTIGINWFVKGQALKFVINYIFSDAQNKPDSHKLILFTQILL